MKHQVRQWPLSALNGMLSIYLCAYKCANIYSMAIRWHMHYLCIQTCHKIHKHLLCKFPWDVSHALALPTLSEFQNPLSTATTSHLWRLPINSHQRSLFVFAQQRAPKRMLPGLTASGLLGWPGWPGWPVQISFSFQLSISAQGITPSPFQDLQRHSRHRLIPLLLLPGNQKIIQQQPTRMPV